MTWGGVDLGHNGFLPRGVIKKTRTKIDISKVQKEVRTHFALREPHAFLILGVFDVFENFSQRSHAFLNFNQVCEGKEDNRERER